MAVNQFLLTIFAIHRYLLFLATTIRRIPQQQVLRGSIESKAYLSYAADSVGAQLTPLTQLVVPKNLRCALIVFYLLLFNTIRPTAQQQVFCCQSELMRKLSLAADSVEMSSSVLPAALRRRRMGLADGLDIGSLLSYGLLITRRELRSSVG